MNKSVDESLIEELIINKGSPQMAKVKTQITSVKGPVVITEKGKALFVSCPAASQYDATKQEATILLDQAGKDKLAGTLQDWIDSPEVKESGLKDKGYVEALFKEDTDADGNSTGLFKVKTKTAMIYPAKLYTASGAVFTPPAGFSLPNRSDIRLSMKPEVMKTSMFEGIVLRLQAIKIIDVPQFDDGMGGVAEEGGFEGDGFGAAEAPDGAPAEHWEV